MARCWGCCRWGNCQGGLSPAAAVAVPAMPAALPVTPASSPAPSAAASAALWLPAVAARGCWGRCWVSGGMFAGGGPWSLRSSDATLLKSERASLAVEQGECSSVGQLSDHPATLQ